MAEYDHEEVTCELMADACHDTLPVGAPRYCCVCIEHNCKEAFEERKRSGLISADAEYNGKLWDNT